MDGLIDGQTGGRLIPIQKLPRASTPDVQYPAGVMMAVSGLDTTTNLLPSRNLCLRFQAPLMPRWHTSCCFLDESHARSGRRTSFSISIDSSPEFLNTLPRKNNFGQA
ncbi:unnamed protein product [Protopolystoma xenopodis]|uniref:Uncharacterized protein n=1 Tax=Protopolystoma xenopodis TaxID=117903 RepID=A0A3S5AJT5_9PLAT|nr:unnamed protein product [Protopolystoma xenopodis]